MARIGSILFLTQTAHPWGGVENWLEYLVPGLEQRGWKVTVGLARGRQHHDPAGYLKIHPYPDTVEVPALTGTPEGRVRAIARVLHQKQPDIVVPVSLADTLEAVRRVKLAGLNLRMLYALHGDVPQYFRDVAYYKGCLDYGVATNRRGRSALISVGGLAPDRTAHVAYGAPPPIDAPKFESPAPALRLAYVGRLLQDQKRIRDLPLLCDELDRRGVRYHLDIAGTGEEEPWLRQQLQAQAASGTVVFHGLCSAEQLYRCIYPGLTALVLLSDWETGPIVAWEAMRHGATIATTNYRGLTMEGLLVPEANALVSPIGDMPGLADSVSRLSADPALTARLRSAAFRTANERCSIEASVQGWHEAFQACLDSPIAMDLPAAPRTVPGGRLDRLFGCHLAETIRSVFGRGMQHNDAGGEWPHSLNYHVSENDETAALLDQSDRQNVDMGATATDKESLRRQAATADVGPGPSAHS